MDYQRQGRNKMKSGAKLAGVLLLQLASRAHAWEQSIDQNPLSRQVCSGMYSRASWGGNMDPFILTKFVTPPDLAAVDPIVSLVVFEWRDEGLLGAIEPSETGAEGDGGTVGDGQIQTGDGQYLTKPVQLQLICDEKAVRQNLCAQENIGAFILAKNASEVSQFKIITEAIHLKDPPAISYPIKQTGYYCVGTYGYSSVDYQGVVEFRNAFGELPAAQIAKLPFYAAITIVYGFLAIGWAALYFMHRRDILPVQNYITAILLFLVVEMFMTWLFYDYQNRNGMNAGAKALLVVVSILSAARNSFSFFLLLIVCMGYGVVRPSLGKKMTYVRWLAITHFVFGVIYAVASLSVTPENAGPLVLLVVLPLAATLTAFYIWTLNSLNATTKDLVERKQNIKAGMYRKLWYCILASIIVIFVFFFVNSWIFAGQSDEDFVPNHWKSRWFILDGWLNLVYLFDVGFVAYVWRPTANNRRFAMSDEIAQDDDGFEIASMRDSLDMEDELEANKGNGSYNGPGGSMNRDASPLPAPVPQKPTPLPRESLEGETIFAVGEEDRLSEDESEDERKGLTQ